MNRRTQKAETQVQRLEENIAFQQQMIAKLDQGGHDVRAARMILKRLKAQLAKLVGERDLAKRS
ncbi:hypothetical protein [Reyranella soli]|uniref:Uncharacterized protein n=1 Tax=Reyranella soli TaxID=1230389 RepID=A0A512NLK6_9HYPH|nr:hypothetical protein [Reyranella soli]GEP59831.1 hypothetical protein RSO01_69970 [Reyranella soli]